MGTWEEAPSAGRDSDSAVPQLRFATLQVLPQPLRLLLRKTVMESVPTVEKTEYLSNRLRRAPCGDHQNHQTAETFMKMDLLRAYNRKEVEGYPSLCRYFSSLLAAC